MFNKKQKRCVKRIHLVTDDGLYDRKAFYTVKIIFYSSSMNDGKFINYDEISSDVIKHISPSIFERLRYTFNLSIEKGIFPDLLKIATVTPLFKKGDNALMDNYRPISVIPYFLKILERIIYNRLYSFFSENNILYEK